MPLALFIILTLCWFTNSEAYVQNRTTTDALVHWSGAGFTLDLYLNPTNSQSLAQADVTAQVAASIAEWNGKSRMTIRQNSTAGTNQESLNEIFFSTDPSVFANGTGVVGVTQVSFKNNTGEMLEADILINDNFTFSTDINEANYLGNVITHEMGHFLGLGHSQVAGSTMFYALSRGQNQIADDDKAGIYSIYPTGDSSKGSLTGKIMGGKSLAAVFGAHVQAISLKTGHISGASISDLDGSFSIAGLDRDDQYYIYTKPIALVGLPSRYNNARFDFCNSSKKYRGSFFQSCGSSGEGYPQAVKLNSSSVAVGNISIRCGLDVPVDYIQNKDQTPALFDIQSNVNSGTGNAFVGYFSSQDIASNAVDYFKMGYSNVSWDAISPIASGNLYAELKVLNQSFYSPFKANIAIKRSGVTTAITPNYVQEADGTLNLETTVRIPINRAVPSDNDFEISVTPEIMEFPYFPAGLPNMKSDYFPAGTTFEDSLYFYLVTASIVRDNGNGTFTQVSYKNEVTTDNSSCPDAINTYALTSYSATGSAAPAGKKKDSGIACGTVDMNGGPGNGPGGFFIGLIFSLILSSLTSSIIKHNKTKHYSKLA
jgi:predicted Zn-dependent protease